MGIPCQLSISVPASPATGDPIRIDEVRRPWIQLAGSWTGDVRLEVSLDGTNYVEFSKAVAPGVFELPSIAKYLRCRTVAMTGTPTGDVAGWHVRDGLPFRSSRARSGQRLLDFSGLTMNRTTKEAVQDPRQNWNFVDLVTPYVNSNVPVLFADGSTLSMLNATNFVQWSEDLSHWTATSSPTLTGGNAAPDGQSDAYQVADTSAVATASIKLTSSSSFSGLIANFTAWVKKDSVTSRFPEFTIARTAGSHSAAVQLNTATGAAVVRSLTGFSSICNVTVLDGGAFWLLCVELGASASGTVDFTVAPAAALTLGGTPDVTAQGSIVVWGLMHAGKAGVMGPSATARLPHRGYIETPAGAAVARNADKNSIAAGSIPASLLSGPVVWKIWPIYNSDEPLSAPARNWFGFPTAGLQFVVNGSNQAVLRLADSAGASLVDVNVTFSAFQALKVLLYPAAGYMRVSGFTTGNGFAYFTPFAFPSATAIQIGNGGASLAQVIDGVVAPPRLYVPPR